MISIITPCYNSEDYIEETYHSIASQTVSDWEWLVVDDSSTDRSIEIIKSLQEKDKRIILLTNTGKKGPGSARNTGIEAAKGDFITFIDSDDIWFPNFLEKSLETIKEAKTKFTYASYERWNEDLTVKFDSFIVPPEMNYKKLLYTCPISCLTAFIDIREVGKLYMPDLPKRQDYALWLDYLKIIPSAVGIQEPLAKYRIRKSSLSANKMKVVSYQFKVYYQHQKIGLFPSLFYTLSWAFHGFLKYRSIKR